MAILFHNKQIETRVESLALQASYRNNPKQRTGRYDLCFERSIYVLCRSG